MGKADTEEVGVYLGGAKYFIALSIAHCDWVVYAVNAGDKPMGHWLLVVPAWWSLAKKIKNLSAPSVRRPTGKMPGMPDYQSSPGWDINIYKHAECAAYYQCLVSCLLLLFIEMVILLLDISLKKIMIL